MKQVEMYDDNKINTEVIISKSENILEQYQIKKCVTEQSNFFNNSNDGLQVCMQSGDDQRYCECCECIITHLMNNKKHAQLLKYLYLKPLNTNRQIMLRLHYKHSSYYRHRKQALYEFAELWFGLDTN